MKILLTVNYLIDTDSYEFWDKNSGRLNIEIGKSLKKRFPQKIKLSDTVYGQRYSLTHKPIDFPNANIIICPICKRPLTDRGKPKPIKELDSTAELADVQMCESCAWELKRDVDIYGIEYVLNRFKEK